MTIVAAIVIYAIIGALSGWYFSAIDDVEKEQDARDLRSTFRAHGNPYADWSGSHAEAIIFVLIAATWPFAWAVYLFADDEAGR